MIEDLDPEVAADLALRVSSMQDRTRSRDARYDWSPAVIVGQWRCRNRQCGTWVPVPVGAMEAFAEFNQQLRARGEASLDQDTILTCDPCRVLLAGLFAKKRREQTERMRAAIIELKQTKDPARERAIVEQLRIWHHPDIDGLVTWLRERDKAGNGRKKGL